MIWEVGWVRRIFGRIKEYFKLVAVLRVRGNIFQIGCKFEKIRN
jgi:hypothetical protein